MGSNNSDFYNSTSKTPPKKKVRKNVSNSHRVQKFRPSWQNKKEYGKWLMPDPNIQTRAICTICNNKSLTADIAVIDKHAESSKHIQNIKAVSQKSQEVIKQFVNKTTEESKIHSSAKRAEIKTCAFVVEHNLSFSVMNHFIDLLKDCYPDSQILQKVQLKPTKAKAIVTNVISDSQKTILCKKLKNTKFSILIDKSTDVSAIKTLCIIVRYYDADEGQIVSRFWKLHQLFREDMNIEAASSEVNSSEAPSSVNLSHQPIAAKSATAELIFNSVKNSFDKFNISFTNVIGFASDGCNTMMGINNSVATRFLEICPGISIMKCICHSMHLCASEACKRLPRTCEDLARDVYNYFKSSSKRQFHFKQFQTFLDLDVHKILHPSQTRWLSLTAVVSRLIEQWTALDEYFKQVKSTVKLRSIDSILYALSDPLVKLYLLFLEWILPKFTELNKLFQSDKPVIVQMYEEVRLIYLDLLKTYMDRDYVNKTAIPEINPADENRFLRPENIYRGSKVAIELQLPEICNNLNLKNDFFKGCTQFVVTGCIEIKKRFNFDDMTLKQISALKPSNAMSGSFRRSVPSLLPLMQELPRLVAEHEYQNIDDEWRKLPDYELPPYMSISDNADIFWHNLYYSDNDDQIYYRFKNLSKFALNAISLPHSNAECERIFSSVNLIKTKTRNKLVTPTVNGLLLASQRVNKDCVSFEPSSEEYSRMTSNILHPKSMNTNKKLNKRNISVSASAEFERSLLAVIDESDESDSESIDNIIMPNTKK